MTVTLEYLRECFIHDAATGALVWKHRPLAHFKNQNAMSAWNAHYAGKPVGTMNEDGYMQCTLFRRRMKLHSVCWSLVHGVHPSPMLDHIDGDRANNAITNLRECTVAENSRNMRQKENATGMKGVRKSGAKFTAQISVDCKKLHLGTLRYGR
jgi:hypothetical protein